MRLVVQRVTHASVCVENKIVGSIQKGFLVFLGIGKEDTVEIADKMVTKLLKLRIFSDENDKINLSLSQVNGQLLILSQFTLYANCSQNRPSFLDAADPDTANTLYTYFLSRCKEQVPVVESGIFGADMQVDLHNDGPFTIVLDSDTLQKKKN